MKILMTGATGLIGREVGQRLASLGHELHVVSRDPEKAKSEIPFPAKCFQWRGFDDPFPMAALEGVEGVIHLAGEPIADGRWTDDRKRRIRDSRVEGTKRLVAAILSDAKTRSRLKVFVLGSAIGIYGDRGDEVLDETSARGTGFLADVVHEWEAQVEPLKTLSDVRVPIVRTSVVFARHGGAIAQMYPLFASAVGGRLGNGQQWMSWIHLEDIARLFVFSLETESVDGILNASAPEPVRNERFTCEFARAIGRPVFLPVPGLALKLVYGDLAGTLLGGARVLPRRTQELGFEFKHPEFVKAIHDIGDPLKSGCHELFAEQWVPYSPKEIFPFFCDEMNLETITPEILGFKVKGKSTKDIGEGTLIDYKISVHGVPMKWRTRIEEWRPNERFVDTQLKGPYSKWHHTHDFIPLAGGTLMRDRVIYKLPLGFVGDVSGGWFVKKDVATIFKFRRKKIEELFGTRKESRA